MLFRRNMKYNSNPSLTDQNSSAKIKQLITQISQAQEDISVIQATLASQGIHFETADLEAVLAEIKNAKITDTTIDNATVATLKASDIDTQSVKSKTADADALTAGSLNVSGTINASVIKGDNLQTTSATIPSIQTQSLTVKEVNADAATVKSLKATVLNATTETAKTITAETIQMPDADAVIRGNYLSIKADDVNSNTFSISGEEILSMLYNLTFGATNRTIELVSQSRPIVKENGVLHTVCYSDEIGNPLKFAGVVSTKDDITDFTAGYVYFATGSVSVIVCDGTAAHEAPMSSLLGAYRTSALQDTVDEGLSQRITDNADAIASVKTDILSNTAAIETEISDRKEAIATITSTVDTLSTTVDTVKSDLADTNTEVETIKTTYTPEAPKDGMLYGRKDGEWKQFDGDATYLNKEYKNAETGIESSITNTENGIVLASTTDIKVSTPEKSIYSDTTKLDILNREYLHSNLTISKKMDSGSTDYTYKMVNGGNEENDGRTYSIIENIGPSTYYEHCSTKRGNAVLRLKDYVVYSIIDPKDLTDSTYTAHINLCDEDGNVYRLEERDACSSHSTTNYYTFVFSTYHPAYIKAHPEYGNIFFAFNCVKNIILVYDGLHLLGEMRLGDYDIDEAAYNSIWPYDTISAKTGSVAASHTTTATMVPQFQFMKNHPYGVVFFSNDKGTGDTHAIFIGKDEDGNEGPTYWKDCPLPMIPTRRSAASGNDNIWFIGGRNPSASTTLINYVAAINTDGEADTFTIQNATTTVNAFTVSPSRAFLECENGNVICPIAAYTTDSPSTALLSWVYCDDTKTETNYEAKLIAGNNGSSDLTASTIADTTGYPYFAETSMFETDSYYYAFPQSPMVPNDYQFIALSAASQNRYYKISKTDLTVENFTTPWTATATMIGSRNVIHTYKNGSRYTWIMPENLAFNTALIVKEDGSTVEKVITLDTDGLTLNFSGDRQYDMYYNSSYATYAQMKTSTFAVNDSGIGFAISTTNSTQYAFAFRGEEYSYRKYITAAANAAVNNWGKDTIGTVYSALWSHVNAIDDDFIFDCCTFGNYYGVNIIKVDSSTLEIQDRSPLRLLNTNTLAVGTISGCYTFLGDIETKYYHWNPELRDNQCKLVVLSGMENPQSGDYVQVLTRWNNYSPTETIYLKDNGQTISHT